MITDANLEDLVEMIRSWQHDLSPGQRIDLWNDIKEGYCDECGYEDPKDGYCQCWNGE